MQSIPLIHHAWQLHKAGQSVDQISFEIGKNRATVFRWFARIKKSGLMEYLRRYEQAKKGRRQKRKTDPITKNRIYAIREEFRHCCGEKIRYWMIKRHNQKVALSTIYRILNEKYQLRPKYKPKNQLRGPLPKAHRPREVIQHDTVDFGGLFAYTSVDIFTREASVVISAGMRGSDGAKALEKHMRYFQFAELFQRDGGGEFEREWEETAKQYCRYIRTARPYKKNEQSYIESFNRTLRKECLGWTKYRPKDLPRVQAKTNEFLDFYNNRRPHLSLNLQAPTEYLSHLR